jgi:ABC-type polysaccharide/polyol phosphate export permease
MFRELIESHELLWALTWRNIQIRYKQTIMGFLWAIFMPIIIILSGIVVKKAMAMFAGRPLDLSQIVSVSVKALPWAFFVGTLKFAVNSLVGNMSLIKKIYFPREVFPLSSVLSQLFDFIIALAFLVIIFMFARIGASIHLLWVPVLFMFLILFVTALGMVLGCANLFFRDVKYIVDVVLTFGIFFTPVFYEARMFGKWGKIILLNPVAAILENLNSVVVLKTAPDYLWLLYAGIWSIGGFFLAWYIFHKTEPLFAEYI